VSGTATDLVDAPRRPAPPSALALAVVVTVAVIVHIPYGLEGPKYLLDDYYTLWFRQSRGLLGTAGPGQLSARPGAWLSYLVEFGVLGHHPLLGYLLLAGFDVLAAALLYRALTRLLPGQVAFAASTLWVVLADHSTLDHWLSTINIVLGLCLLLAGVDRLAAAATRGRGLLVATSLLVASGLCYEATLAVSAVALVAVTRILGRPAWSARTAFAETAVVATGFWMLVHTRHQLGGGGFDYRSLPMSLFGTGVVRIQPIGDALLVATFALIAVSAAREWKRSGDLGCHLVLAGLVVIVAGTVAFARDPISPLDLGDRVNQVAAIGAALVWTGGIAQLGHVRWAARAALVTTLLVASAGYVSRDLDYRDAGRDDARIIHAVFVAYPAPPKQAVVVGPVYLTHHGVTGMLGPEGQAFDALTGRRDWEVWVALSPTQFTSSPPALRVVVH